MRQQPNGCEPSATAGCPAYSSLPWYRLRFRDRCRQLGGAILGGLLTITALGWCQVTLPDTQALGISSDTTRERPSALAEPAGASMEDPRARTEPDVPSLSGAHTPSIPPEPRDERRRLALIGLSLLLLIALLGLGTILLLLRWGQRLRRQVRQPHHPTPAWRELWFLQTPQLRRDLCERHHDDPPSSAD
ncbi:MAG: hypothetical protein KatS3mg114_0587 [Planctomycetaceae bacterium]|nr:MAG: hypothetical protein KatS3mg114_0587 [Planctomycetaceae bacterium]